MRVTVTALLAGLLAVTPAAGVAAQESEGPHEELRGFWVDAFNEGIYDQDQIDELVLDAQAAEANALFVQVGRRFDCFCNASAFPRTDAAVDPAPFDPLAAVIEAAHAVDLEVHAWINATTVWNQATPPSSPDHVFNSHGPDADDSWLNRRRDGEELMGGVNAYLDPAHPDAVAYVVDGVRSVIEAYDVDGVNFDYIRYPDFNTPEVFASDWGYSETSLARFAAASGRDDVPDADDEEFADWRRDQVSNLVRQLYLSAYDTDPSVRVSVNTVTYAFGPETYGGWEGTRPYLEVLQDWRAWMEEGIVDLNVPMNYKRNWMEDQAQMFTEWTDAIGEATFDRHAVNGTATYLNDIDDTVAQVEETQAAGLDGWVGYSYANPALETTGEPLPERRDARGELIAALTEGASAPFADPAAVPEMTWKTAPTTGHVAGDVVTRDGTVADQIEVELWQRGQVVDTILTDGNGWFGFVDVAPGRYQVRVAPSDVRGPRLQDLTVRAGELTDAAVRPVALR
jgi:uncharacterized lipoprotein YddW (UPF0748 family)